MIYGVPLFRKKERFFYTSLFPDFFIGIFKLYFRRM